MDEDQATFREGDFSGLIADFVLIEAEIAQYCEETKKTALDQASVQMAQVVPERVTRKKARQDITAALIVRIKPENPGWSIERICQRLDATLDNTLMVPRCFVLDWIWHGKRIFSLLGPRHQSSRD